jgi:hypothetical protein
MRCVFKTAAKKQFFSDNIIIDSVFFFEKLLYLLKIKYLYLQQKELFKL